MTIGCGIKNQTELFQADLLLRCFILHHMAYYNRFLQKRKLEQNFQDWSIFFSPERFFLKKLVPDQNFQQNKISVTDHITAKAYRSLGLLRRSFSNSVSIPVKKTLYISLVRSQLTYGSQLWHPHLIKDIVNLEQVQRCATCFILNEFNSSYKSRLLNLNLFPLMYLYLITMT